MTTYNGEKYLREQLDSILCQTYSDFELIICDDCSSDNTCGILNEYKQKDIRIKVYINETNLGFKKNFEKAISFCKGDYIAFCDQDDVWENWKLQESLDSIGDNYLICTDSLLVDSQLNSLNRTFKQNLGIKKVCMEQEFLLKNLIHHSFIQGATVICSREFVQRHLPIPDDCIYHDLYFGICAVIENSITYLDKPTLKYRQHENNVIGNKKKSKLSFLLPSKYDREKIIKRAKEKLCLINLELCNIEDSETRNYLFESIRYYEDLPDKTIYTIKYLSKYFEYMVWTYSTYRKRLTILKRFIGMIIYKLFYKKKQNQNNSPK